MGARRGFTLIEMMIVVVIIGLFAALAAPSVTSLVRDQRVRRESLAIMDIYRDARSRSLGRGAAVLVNYQGDAGIQSEFIVKEAVTGYLPDSNCRTYNWAVVQDPKMPVATAATVLKDLTPGRSKPTPMLEVVGSLFLVDDSQTSRKYIDLCYAPRGRVFVRTAATDPFVPLAGRVELAATRLDPAKIGITRVIEVNPDGTTRMKL